MADNYDPTGSFLGSMLGLDPQTAQQYQAARDQQGAIGGFGAGLMNSGMHFPGGYVDAPGGAFAQGMLQAQAAVPQQALQAAQAGNQTAEAGYHRLQGQQLARQLGNMPMYEGIVKGILNRMSNGGAPGQADGQPAAAPTINDQGQIASPVHPIQNAIWKTESGGRVDGVPNGTSGEIGPMQIMPDTGKMFGASIDDLRDPQKNIHIGGSIIQNYAQKYNGDPTAVAIAYNAGPGAADKYVASGGDLSVIPASTRDNYLPKFHSNLAAFAGTNSQAPVAQQGQTRTAQAGSQGGNAYGNLPLSPNEAAALQFMQPLTGMAAPDFTKDIANLPAKGAEQTQNKQIELQYAPKIAGATTAATEGAKEPYSYKSVTMADPDRPGNFLEGEVPLDIYRQGPAAAIQFLKNGRMAPGAPMPSTNLLPQGTNAPSPLGGSPMPPSAPKSAPVPMVPQGAAAAPAASQPPLSYGKSTPPPQNPLYEAGVKTSIDSDSTLMSKTYVPDAQKGADMVNTATLIKSLLPNVKTGWGAETVNQAASILYGLGADGKAIEDLLGTNPSDAAVLNKKFLEQSAQAVRAMGAREPGSVISLFGKAYPGLSTPPEAITLMENLLTMQGKWYQDRQRMAAGHMNEQVNGLAQNQQYKSLSNFEAAIPNGLLDPQWYQKAAEVMSGRANAWKGLTKQQAAAVYNVLPPGMTFVRPDGTQDVKPNG